MSISRASGLPRVWTSRIFLRPLRSGRSTTIWRSKRPGRSSAGSENVRPVGRGDQDDVVLHLEPVHLDQQLVQGLLALVVPATEARAPVAPDGVDLVHEDDAGRVLLGLLEQVPHPRSADADEHLDEVRAGDREERHACFARNRARKERLAGPGRPVQQHALGDPRAQRLELLRVLEELLDLVQLLDRLVDARHVAEGDLRRVNRHPLGARLAERHHLGAAALNLVHQEDPEADEDHERQDVGQQRQPAATRLALDVEVTRGQRLRVGDDLRDVAIRVPDRVLLAVGQRDVRRVVLLVQRHALHLAVLELVDHVAEGLLLGVARAANQLLGEERQHDHDQDRESGALEKPAHEFLTGKRPQSSGPDDLKRSTCVWGFGQPWTGMITRSTRRHKASFGIARRSRDRSRSRTGSGSRTRRIGSTGPLFCALA